MKALLSAVLLLGLTTSACFAEKTIDYRCMNNCRDIGAKYRQCLVLCTDDSFNVVQKCTSEQQCQESCEKSGYETHYCRNVCAVRD